jgi:hypothetical protein
MNVVRRALHVGFLAALASAGCWPRPPEPTTGARSTSSAVSTGADRTPPVGPGSTTADTVVDARCDREASCHTIGEGRTYRTRAVCLAATRSEWAAELDAYDDVTREAPPSLPDCVEAIRTADCTEPLEHVGEILGCNAIGALPSTPTTP